jgi:hypothetical protein
MCVSMCGRACMSMRVGGGAYVRALVRACVCVHAHVYACVSVCACLSACLCCMPLYASVCINHKGVCVSVFLCVCSVCVCVHASTVH